MTYGAGRDFLIKIGDGGAPEAFTTIGGMRTTSMSVNNSQIDITNKDDAGWRTLVSGGIHSMSLSFAGVMSNAATVTSLKARVIAENGSDICNFQVISGLGDIWQGAFQVASFEGGGDVGKEEVFNLKLESAGRITKVA